MRNSIVYFIATAVALGIASCNGGGGGKPEEAGTIKIGHFASLTGKEATFGSQVDNGVRLALEEINGGGGVLGKKIDVITEDTRSTSQEAISAVEKLIGRDKVIALLGEVASSRSIAAAPIAERDKVPMISPASTNEQVTLDKNGGTRQYVFRICFIDPFQGTVMAKFAHDNLKFTRVAILKDNANDYSVGLANNFRQTFAGLGGQVVTEQAYEGGQVDFAAQLTAIKATNPQAIFIPGYYTEVSLIATQARRLGITVPLLGGDGWDSPVLTQGEAKQALEGCFFSNHYSNQDTSKTVQDFVSRYKAKYKELPGAMSALGYDAMHIVAKTIKDGGKADAETIKNGLANLKNYQGVTGNISIDGKHNASKPAVIIQIKNGEYSYFTTVAP